MFKDDRVYLEHMLEISQKAVKALGNKKRQEYDNDEILLMALAHFIQVIGEAARRVSQPFQDAHPEIPWRQAIGMRHRIVHDYMNVDEDVVWEVVTCDLPTLISALEKIVSPNK